MRSKLDRFMDWLFFKRDVFMIVLGLVLLGVIYWLIGCSLLPDFLVGGVVSQDQSQTTIDGNVYDPWIARILAVAGNAKEALFLLAYVLIHRWKPTRRVLNRFKGKQDLDA